MSRSVVLPLLGLAGILLFSITRAGKPAGEMSEGGPAPATAPSVPQMIEMPAPPPMPEPPPAPRLRSDIEAEEAAASAPDSALAEADSAAVAAVGE